MLAVDYTNGLITEDLCGTLEAAQSKRNRGQGVIAYRTSPNNGAWETGSRTDALTTNTDRTSTVLRAAQGVRRLTPRECERLQGFPDDYTAIDYNGKPAADGPRYEALGNSMAVPVLRWIGKRIEAVEAMSEAAA